eukprot:11899336-Alexandrium_andersonii.AAC.1
MGSCGALASLAMCGSTRSQFQGGILKTVVATSAETAGAKLRRVAPGFTGFRRVALGCAALRRVAPGRGSQVAPGCAGLRRVAPG